jgi:hypothetical protein
MEREFIGTSVYHKVRRADLQAVSDHACRYYRISCVRIVVYDNPDDGTMGMYERYEYDDGTVTNAKIRLNRGYHGANIAVLVHELAHYIVDNTYSGHEPHGKQFIGVYMHLLDKYRIMPCCAFRALAKKHKVKIAGKFKPDAIR